MEYYSERQHNAHNAHNYIIDIVKFVLSLIILLYHYNISKFGWNSRVLFGGGYVCVDAFFVFSGYFCAKTVLSLPQDENVFDYLYRRLKTLWPCYILCLVLAVIVNTFVLADDKAISSNFIAIIQEVFLVQEWGLIDCNAYYNSATWYISAMMFTSLFYFILSKRLNIKRQTFLISTLSMLSLVMILLKFGNIHIHGIVKRHLSLGVMRSLVGMGIGWLLFRYQHFFDNMLSSIRGTKAISAIFLISMLLIILLAFYVKDSILEVFIYPTTSLVLMTSKYFLFESQEAVGALRILVWSQMLAFISVTRSIWILCEKKVKYVKYYVAIGSVVNVVLNYFLIPSYGIIGASVATLCTSIVVLFISPIIFSETRSQERYLIEGFFLVWLFRRPKDDSC